MLRSGDGFEPWLECRCRPISGILLSGFRSLLQFVAVLCNVVLTQTAVNTFKVWSVILPPTAIPYCSLWSGSLGCVNHPGNLCPLKAAVRTGGPSRRRFRFCGRILAPHTPLGSVSGSPVAGVLWNKLVALGEPLLPTFVYTTYILIWSWPKLHNFIFI
jgi:hypothetical protein